MRNKVNFIFTMSDDQEINSFLQKQGSLSRQSFIFKGLATSSKCASKLDLNGLLELLSFTNDVNLQLKVFSTMSAYLMFNKGANVDVLIKCNAVYNKILNVISVGLPRKCTEALNFLSALLSIGDPEEDSTTKLRTLSLYARNMTRVSGCLSSMCEMLANCMMYHDTWKALCQCLAIACSGCAINQSYCSHLIPVCIQKCSQVTIDILLVLQSLLLNHSRNVQLFLDCNGVSIFTRELLHSDKCMQVLVIVVQCSKTSAPLLQRSNVVADLRDFLRLYGPDSQLGQMAIIILNSIRSSAKGKDIRHNTLASEAKMHANNLPTNIDDTFQRENDFNENTDNDFDETKVLLQNVMKEVYNWKQSELQNLKIDASKYVLDAVNRTKKPSIASKQNIYNKTQQLSNLANTKIDKINKLMDKSRTLRMHSKKTTELSYTFLQKDEFQVPEHKDKTKTPFTFYRNDNKRLHDNVTQRNDTTFYGTTPDAKKYYKPATLKEFRPNFASTPLNTTESNAETTASIYKTSEEQTKQNKYMKLKMKRKQAKREQQNNKVMKNRSISARFIGAINDSCTTFVKTVKNIFNKEPSDDNRSSSSNPAENSVVKGERSTTYSFINYMRKRDAVLSCNRMRDKITDRSDYSTKASSCKTCDNTLLLKRKLHNDEFLKQTVKKLKVGINLYGCDFKKISKTIWPRETYMTPQVLRNLYRKLLRK